MGWEVMGVALIGLCNLLLQWRTAKLPLHPDSGLFLYRAVLKRMGERFLPGRWERQGYGGFVGDYARFKSKIILYLLMNAFYRFVPPNPKHFRYFFAFWNILAIVFIFLLGELLGGTPTGLVAAMLYAMFSANPFSDSSQLHVEHYAVGLQVASYYLFAVGYLTGDSALFFASGLLSCILVTLFKITFVLDGMALSVLPLLGGRPTDSLCVLSGQAVGFIGVFVVCWRHGALESLFITLGLKYGFTSQRHYRRWMASDFKAQGGIRGLRPRTLLQVSSYGLPAAVMASALYFLNGYHMDLHHGLPLVMASTGVAALLIQGKYYLSHFFPLYGPLAIIMGSGLAGTARLLGDGPGGTFPLIAVSVSILFFAPWLRDLGRYTLKYSPLEYHLNKCAVRGYRSLAFLAGEIIAKYIRDKTGQGDRIVQWGYHHELYVLAGRRAALGKKLELDLQSDPLLNDRVYGPQWRSWFIDSVMEQRPAFIADMDGTLNIDVLNRCTGLSYNLDKVFYGLFPVYRLRDGKNRETPDNAECDLQSLYSTQGKELIQRVTHLVNWGEISEANRLTNGQIFRMFQDWKALNSVR